MTTTTSRTADTIAIGSDRAIGSDSARRNASKAVRCYTIREWTAGAISRGQFHVLSLIAASIDHEQLVRRDDIARLDEAHREFVVSALIENGARP